MKVLIDNAAIVGDLGGPSIVSAFCYITRQNIDNAQIDILLPSISKKEEEYLNYLNIGYVVNNSFLSLKNIFKISKSVIRCKKGKVCREHIAIEKFIYRLNEYDVIVDMGGICFTDDIPSKNLLHAMLAKRIWILCKKLGIKVVLYTTAIGPFKTNRNIWSFKMYLNKYCDYAIMRDKKSEALYREYGIKTPFCVAPDTAFLMNSVQPSGKVLKWNLDNMHIIGISLSFQLQKRTKDYFDIMKKVCQEILERGLKLLLIANECSEYKEADDRFVVRKMADELNSENILIVDPVEMNGNELKWVISQCEAVISSRYHTLIAAISSGVPCLALSWHHKYREALSLVGQEKYIVENSKFEEMKIINLFSDLYENREENKKIINKNIEKIREKVFEANNNFLNA